MHSRDIHQFLQNAAGLPLLVIGDLMLDAYVWGNAARISPEAPVQVVDVQREENRLGGAGNVARNLRALGCQVTLAGVVGNDADAEVLRQLVTEEGLSSPVLVVCPQRLTTRKTRVLASKQQMLRIDRESRIPLGGEIEDQLIEAALACMALSRSVLVSDYGKGGVTPRLLREIIARGRSLGIPVLVDPKGRDFSRYRGATLLTPNRKEAAEALGRPLENESQLHAAGKDLCRDLELDALVLTRSEEGMSLFFPQGEEIHLPTQAREVFDVSGAGDTVLSVLGAALGAGLDLPTAARLANLAAGIVVGKVGTAPITVEELQQAVVADSGPGKIVSFAKAKERVDQAKARGRRVVFTNGCFDLLHIGHVRYLQEARALGDLLVLGLNTDASIRRLKGPQRPLIQEDERAHILAALDCIDLVVLFDQDTPLELITLLQPDILVKGGDYQASGVVGREVVEVAGGRVEIIPLVGGRSTTSLVEKILQAYRDEGNGQG